MNPLLPGELAEELSAQFAASQKQFPSSSRNLLKSDLQASSDDPEFIPGHQDLRAIVDGPGAVGGSPGESLQLLRDSFQRVVRFENARATNLAATAEIVFRGDSPVVPGMPGQGASASLPVAQPPAPAVEQLAAELSEKIKDSGCRSSSCKLLVANFSTTSGTTSHAGHRLTEQLAALIGKQLPKIKVIDRNSLQSFLKG